MKKSAILSWFVLFLFIYSCANTGTPSGGPKDITPPKIIRSVPNENQTEYKKKRIDLFFDELVSLQNVSDKVIISPPQKIPPSIKALNNRIAVVFQDSLQDSTTYTIDFTDAIVDYNEGNKYGDYAFSFSTGSHIDSLRISGYLIDAATLNPVEGVFIGVHDQMDDSVFLKDPFSRISKTSKTGYFSVKGLPAKTFRLFALDDKSSDYVFNQPVEAIAFMDSLISPYTEMCIKEDTIWKDSVTVDSIIYRPITCYKPDNIVLKSFLEEPRKQYLTKRERPEREKIFLSFANKSSVLPKITLLGHGDTPWYQTIANTRNDSIVYWITDSAVILKDTLSLEVSYFKTDSTDALIPATDTLNLIYRKPKSASTSLKPATSLSINTTFSPTLEVYSRPSILFDFPLKSIQETALHLFIKKDTLWLKEPFSLSQDTLNLQKYYLNATWKFGDEYQFEIDSGQIIGLYGQTNNYESFNFRIRPEEEYSRITVRVTGINGPGFVELLNGNDAIVRKLPLKNGVVDFKYLSAGTYYMRAVDDSNGNGIWDTGNYLHKQQPEAVYYNPKAIVIREYWELEESWDVLAVPLLEQKPKALIKNTGKSGK